MPSRFSPPTTAEQVVAAVDAISVNLAPTNITYVAEFTDLPQDQAESALLLASDLGFLKPVSNSNFGVASPLCRFLATKDQMQKATVLRVLLESYQPFVVFRQRLRVASTITDAAKQTKAALGLAEHHGDVGASLISLGSFSQAVHTTGEGHYEIADATLHNELEHLMKGCSDQNSAEELVWGQLGVNARSIVSRERVVLPLTDAVQRAHSEDARGAVVQAGNAIETFIMDYASRIGVTLKGTGINAKIDEIKRHDISKMPTKLSNVGKYLGHVRNAADHGVDQDIGAQWYIRKATGIEYVFVACSFIATTTILETGNQPEL